MKVAVQRTDLVYAVNAASKAIAVKSVDDKFAGITIVAENDELTLTARNGEMLIEVSVKADVIESGEVTVPGKTFAETARKTSGEETEIEHINGEMRASISYSGGSLKIPVLPNGNVAFKELEETAGIKIKVGDFKKMVQKVQAYTAKDEARPILKGICLCTKDGELVAVACDGFKLAKNKVAVEKDGAEDIRITVPCYSMQTISSLLEDDDALVELGISSKTKQLCVKQKGIKIVSVVLNGEYMNYDAIIPKQFATTSDVMREDLVESLERSLLVGDGKGTAILTVDVNEVGVHAAGDVGELNDSVGAYTQGKTVKIGFNAKYLIEALKNIKSEKAKLQLNTGNHPMVIEETDTLFLLMPMRMPKGAEA